MKVLGFIFNCSFLSFLGSYHESFIHSFIQQMYTEPDILLGARNTQV